MPVYGTFPITIKDNINLINKSTCVSPNGYAVRNVSGGSYYDYIYPNTSSESDTYFLPNLEWNLVEVTTPNFEYFTINNSRLVVGLKSNGGIQFGYVDNLENPIFSNMSTSTTIAGSGRFCFALVDTTTIQNGTLPNGIILIRNSILDRASQLYDYYGYRYIQSGWGMTADEVNSIFDEYGWKSHNPTPIPPNEDTDGNEGNYDDSSDLIELPTIPTIPTINNGFSTIYKITNAQLINLSSFLWSDSFFDNIIKMFENPMECIKGLFYCRYPISVGSSTPIKLGNVSSDINAPYVISDYVTVDCGTLNVSEYFGNALDYDSKVSIYLPYVGIKELNINEIMDSSISVIYYVQVSTGVSVCYIYINKSLKGTELNAPLYMFDCNCNAQIPISASDNSNIYTSLLNLTTGVGQMASGNLLGGALNLASNVMSMSQHISSNGGSNGISGVMGVQTPYLIIQRPINAYPEDYNVYNGLPSYQTKKIDGLKGFNKFVTVELDNLDCTEEEKIEIENILTSGFFIK